MALSTARIHRVRGRPPLLAAGITSLIHSHSSSVRSLGYIFSFIYPFYTTHEDFSDRLSASATLIISSSLCDTFGRCVTWHWQMPLPSVPARPPGSQYERGSLYRLLFWYDYAPEGVCM